MERKFQLSADSTCDLSPELIRAYGVIITPLYVNLGDKTYRDGVDISPEDIYAYVDKTGKLPTTAACTTEDYQKIFRQAREQGLEALHINISHHMSCSYQNAMIAREGFIAREGIPGVEVVDSLNLSSATGHAVLEAAMLGEQGMGAKETAAYLNTLTPRVRASFIIERLDYLYKGGRCTSLQMLGANLLSLKPSILVKDGQMGVGEKFRGTLSKVLDKYVEQQLTGRNDLVLDRIFITHTGCTPETVQQVAEKIRSLQPFQHITETRAGSVITSHCGQNTLGILYKVKA